MDTMSRTSADLHRPQAATHRGARGVAAVYQGRREDEQRQC